MMTTNSELFTKLFNQVTQLTLPEPALPQVVLRPFEDDLETLLSTGAHHDFELKFGETIFKLHTYVLSQWNFFNVLKHSNEHEPLTGMPVQIFRFVNSTLFLFKILYCTQNFNFLQIHSFVTMSLIKTLCWISFVVIFQFKVL